MKLFQVSDVLGETSTARGAALRRTHVGRGRGTVTGPGTAARMTDTGAAGATWSAGATTASSSAPTTTPRQGRILCNNRRRKRGFMCRKMRHFAAQNAYSSINNLSNVCKIFTPSSRTTAVSGPRAAVWLEAWALEV